jgi:hypothetical protein
VHAIQRFTAEREMKEVQVGPIADALNKMFGIANGWGPYLLAVGGLGTFTMAIIQTLKDITPVRRWYQSFEMRRWLKAHAALAVDNLGIISNSIKAEDQVVLLASEAEEQIVLLATDCDQRSFYDLEIEKLCGQWSAAIQLVMDYPHLYPEFLQCVAARATKVDFERVMSRNYPDPLPPDVEAQLSLGEQKSRFDSRQAFTEARKRVMHQIQRAVDAFQINTSFRWKWLLQMTSFLLSFSLAAFAIVLSKGPVDVPGTLVSAAFVGFLAPVARDLFAAIQKLRN